MAPQCQLYLRHEWSAIFWSSIAIAIFFFAIEIAIGDRHLVKRSQDDRNRENQRSRSFHWLTIPQLIAFLFHKRIFFMVFKLRLKSMSKCVCQVALHFCKTSFAFCICNHFDLKFLMNQIWLRLEKLPCKLLSTMIKVEKFMSCIKRVNWCILILFTTFDEIWRIYRLSFCSTWKWFIV